jgi:molybdopterin molybdotransferase
VPGAFGRRYPRAGRSTAFHQFQHGWFRRTCGGCTDCIHRAAGRTAIIVADIPAGQLRRRRSGPGQAARIMTGAPLPQGADAVIPVEDTNFAPDRAAPAAGGDPWACHHFESMQIHQVTASARAGKMCKPGSCCYSAAAESSRKMQECLLNTGKARLCLSPPAGIALFSSGDELVQPGSPLLPGQIYDSNQLCARGPART